MLKKQRKNSDRILLTRVLGLFGIKELSIYQLTLSFFVLSAVVSVGLITVLYVYAELAQSKVKIRELKENTVSRQKQKLKEEVNNVIFYLQHRKSDTLFHTLNDIQNEALDYFKDRRFGNDGYIFINTIQGQALLFDGQKIAEPKDISNLTDPNGYKIFEKELELYNTPEGGYFEYLFKKIYDQNPNPKISYVKGFKDWGWIVGTGDYFDNIDAEIVLLKEQFNKYLFQKLLMILFIFGFVIFFLILLSSWLARRIQNQFTLLVNIIKSFSSLANSDQALSSIFIHDLKKIGGDIINAEKTASQFGNLINHSINEIYIFDIKTLKFLHVNSGAEKNCGYTIDEFHTMTALDLKPQISELQFRTIVEELEDGQLDQVRFNTVHQRKNKSFYPVEVHLTKSIFNDTDVYVAFIYDISERKKAEKALKESEIRYSSLFENAPLSIWEEDFTELIEYLNLQMEQYKMSAQELFDAHPEILIKCSSMAQVCDVNKQTLMLYEAKSKADLIGNLDKTFASDSKSTFKQSLLALINGERSFSIEGKNKTLTGKELDLLFRWTFDTAENQKVIVSVIDLTDLRKTELELNESEKRYRALYHNSPDMFVSISPKDANIIECNQTLLTKTGYTREEVVGHPVFKMYHPESTADAEIVFNEFVKTGLVLDKELILKKKGGEKIFVNLNVNSVKNSEGEILYSISSWRDISEKHQAELEIESAKNKIESVFRAAPTGIGVLSERVFTEVNQRFCEITGYSEKELLGKETILVYPSKEEFERVGKVKYEQISDKGTGTVETQFKRKDGKIIDVLMSSTPIDINDLTLGVTFTALDITDRKKDLQELEKHQFHIEELVKERTDALTESQNALLNLVDDLNLQSEKLGTANNRLAEINDELETFTYSVSHDLKAPLRGIEGYSQLLVESNEGLLDEESKRFLSNIRKSTMQMNMLIEDLLAYSRLERKGYMLEPVIFSSIVKTILLQYQAEIDRGEIKIAFAFTEDLIIDTDKESLMMVMRNLIDNAIKFSVKSDNPKIEIGSMQSNTESIIFVKDNGIGFNMKYHDRIFKIFQRLHLAEEYQGTGIGLAMVSKAVQRMHGQIWAESEVGKGASFYMKIEK